MIQQYRRSDCWSAPQLGATVWQSDCLIKLEAGCPSIRCVLAWPDLDHWLGYCAVLATGRPRSIGLGIDLETLAEPDEDTTWERGRSQSRALDIRVQDLAV